MIFISHQQPESNATDFEEDTVYATGVASRGQQKTVPISTHFD